MRDPRKEDDLSQNRPENMDNSSQAERSFDEFASEENSAENKNNNNNNTNPDEVVNEGKDAGTGLYDLGTALGGAGGGVVGYDNPATPWGNKNKEKKSD